MKVKKSIEKKETEKKDKENVRRIMEIKKRKPRKGKVKTVWRRIYKEWKKMMMVMMTR